MVVNVPKPVHELREIVSDYKSLFIVTCEGCPVGCESISFHFKLMWIWFAILILKSE